MGKRKSSSKPVAKKRADPLSTTFKCLFCHHDKSVTCKLDRQVMYGHLNCKVCGQRYSTPINTAVDVYCDWKDACEELRQKQPPKERPARAPQPISHGVAGGAAFDNRALDIEGDPDADADGEVDPDVEGSGSRARKSNSISKNKSRDYDDDEDDDDDDVDDLDDEDTGRDKRRRVAADYDEDEDD